MFLKQNQKCLIVEGLVGGGVYEWIIVKVVLMIAYIKNIYTTQHLVN